MGEIKVNFGELDAAAGHLNQTSSKIQQELHDLEGFLRPLIETWDGQAKEEYFHAQQEWNKAAQNLHEICAKIGVAVRTANESYQQGERRNAGRFGG